MFEKLKSRLEKIRSSNEKIKRRWLVLMSVITMLFILILWGAYANIVKNNENNSSVGFWQIFTTGIKVISSSFINGVKGFITSERTITIE